MFFRPFYRSPMYRLINLASLWLEDENSFYGLCIFLGGKLDVSLEGDWTFFSQGIPLQINKKNWNIPSGRLTSRNGKKKTGSIGNTSLKGFSVSIVRLLDVWVLVASRLETHPAVPSFTSIPWNGFRKVPIQVWVDDHGSISPCIIKLDKFGPTVIEFLSTACEILKSSCF